jgi:hypothetical protein
MQLTMQICASLKVIPQPVWVALYVHIMALSKRMEWAIFRKGKGKIILTPVSNHMNGDSANQL